MTTTANRGYQVPQSTDDLATSLPMLQSALSAIDNDMGSLLGSWTTLAVVTNTITPVSPRTIVDTVGDDLVDITDILGGTPGNVVLLKIFSADRRIILKHDVSKIDCGGSDITLSRTTQVLAVVCISSGVWSVVQVLPDLTELERIRFSVESGWLLEIPAGETIVFGSSPTVPTGKKFVLDWFGVAPSGGSPITNLKCQAYNATDSLEVDSTQNDYQTSTSELAAGKKLQFRVVNGSSSAQKVTAYAHGYWESV